MKIFFDTEFTGLHKNTTLISIGLIDENDRSFYAEFTDYNLDQCDSWIKDNVINNLIFKHRSNFWIDEIGEETICKGNKEFIREKLKNWLSYYDDIELVSDCCHYDMVLLIDLFNSALSTPFVPICHDINEDIANHYTYTCNNVNEAFDINRESLLNTQISGNKHNALYDAKVIKTLYKQFYDSAE